jgi:DNA-binding NarL/FixJ family response regulator
MTPEALIVTNDFELGHMARIAVERLGIDAGAAMRAIDAGPQLSNKKFDVLVVDCSDMKEGCATLRAGRSSKTNHSSVNVAIVPDPSCVRAACDAGANFVLQRSNYEPEIVAILRAAYGLILRERGRYNRFPLGTSVQIRCGECLSEGWIDP